MTLKPGLVSDELSSDSDRAGLEPKSLLYTVLLFWCLLVCWKLDIIYEAAFSRELSSFFFLVPVSIKRGARQTGLTFSLKSVDDN